MSVRQGCARELPFPIGLPGNTTSGAFGIESKKDADHHAVNSLTNVAHRRTRQFCLISEPFIVMSLDAFTLILP